MKRWILNASIAAYIGALAFGFLCVTCQVRFFFPPIYFLTFDMYGGWSGYDAKMQVLGEGESGRFYRLSPGPWGEFHPYSGNLSRQCYDQEFEYGRILARPGLRHTTHEPILRMIVIEQQYPKKFNLPDAQYAAYYTQPNPHRIYSSLRMVLNSEGEIVTQNQTWLRYQDNRCLDDNPRLVGDATRNRPFLWSAQQTPGPGGYPEEALATGQLQRAGSPVAE